MDGIFLKKKSSFIFNIIGLISGVFLMVMFGFFWLNDVSAKSDDKFGYIFFTLFGFIDVIFCCISLGFNYKAFLHIDGDHISARFNWNTKLECDFSEIIYANYKFRTLTIKLSNGKRHIISGLENAPQIYAEIRKKNIRFDTNLSSFDKDMLLSKIKYVAHKRRNELIFIIFGFIAIFVNIFICVDLTGGKEIELFNKQDRIVFGIFLSIEILTFIIVFFVAARCGKNMILLNEKELLLRQSVIQNTPLLPGYLLKMYTDDKCTLRLTVFGLPNTEQVYYTLEGLNDEYSLENIFTSEFYSCIEDLYAETDIHELYEINIKQPIPY